MATVSVEDEYAGIPATASHCAVVVTVTLEKVPDRDTAWITTTLDGMLPPSAIVMFPARIAVPCTISDAPTPNVALLLGRNVMLGARSVTPSGITRVLVTVTDTAAVHVLPTHEQLGGNPTGQAVGTAVAAVVDEADDVAAVVVVFDGFVGPAVVVVVGAAVVVAATRPHAVGAKASPHTRFISEMETMAEV
jgi:hypothetical protein